jgi:choline dehydrogenase-like flavoprotein
MAHPAALVYGLFEEPTQCNRGAFGGQLVNQDSYAKNTHAAAGAFGSYQWMIAQAVRPNDLLGIATTRPDLFGDDLHRFMRHSAKHFATMTGVIEDLPVADNAITLSDQLDANGVPVARVTHTTHAKSKALWAAALEEGKAVFEAAGATEVWTGPQATMHIMGGTAMGDDPASSVTNSFGQCHDVPNLVIAGSGLFPTSGGVNPTFTIHALAARASEHLVANWNSIIR